MGRLWRATIRWPSVQALGLLIVVLLLGLGSGFYWTSEITLVGIYTLVIIGLNLFMGYTGQVSLGQAGFFGIGAYGVGILSVSFHLSPWLGLLAGVVVSALVAWVLGVATLHLREHFLALATLAFGIIADVAFEQLPLTGGNSGLSGIPGLGLGNGAFGFYGFLVFTWVAVALAAWFAKRLVHSGTGGLLEAVRSSEVATSLMGINPSRIKQEVFILSAIFAALAGGIYASWIGYIDPTVFTFALSISLVLMAVVGGLRSVFGAVVGVSVVEGISQVLKTVGLAIPQLGSGALEMSVYGLVLVVVMMFWPHGLVTASLAWRRKRQQTTLARTTMSEQLSPGQQFSQDGGRS